MRTAFACLLFALTAPVNAQSGNYSNAELEQLNLKFRSLYARARCERIVGISPVIIARGDSLVLIQRGERMVGNTVHPNYHDLKTIAHIPLGIFCAVSPREPGRLSKATIEQLREFHELMDRTLASLDNAFPKQQRPRQQQLIRDCMAFTDSVIKKGSCSAEALDEFVDAMRPEILRNVEDATHLRIDNYHAQMKKWRPLLSDAEWKRLYVIIPGAALPRKNSMAVQYFAKLLQEPGEGRRIIYAESQFDESQDMLLLGTHILDAEAARAFFNDPWRLQRDMLGAAADSYLDTLDFDDFASNAGR